MTTDELKAVLRAVLNEPAAPSSKSFRSSLWKFLNSTFGMWVLSAVVIGAFSHWYADRALKAAAENDRAREMRRIESEVMLRFFVPVEVLSYYWHEGHATAFKNWVNGNHIYTNQMRADPLLNESGEMGLLHEFRAIPTAELFYKYQALTKSTNAWRNLNAAIACLREASFQQKALAQTKDKSGADDGNAEKLTALSNSLESAFYLWIEREKDIPLDRLHPKATSDGMYRELMAAAPGYEFPILIDQPRA